MPLVKNIVGYANCFIFADKYPAAKDSLSAGGSSKH